MLNRFVSTSIHLADGMQKRFREEQHPTELVEAYLPNTASSIEADAGDMFHFVPADASDADAKRRARSHAVKIALQQKRKLQRDTQTNFRIVSSKTSLVNAGKDEGSEVPTEQRLRRGPSSGLFDPFQVLAVDSRMFQKLLHDRRARQASEPVFSIAPDSSFHSFPAVFRGGLDDPALGNAVMLMLAFSVAEGCINSECLRYQTLALGELRERMSSVERATTLGTLGTILFLAGVEARLGKRDHVQTHLNAVQRILELGGTKGLYLTPGIKRAIFWQDLNSSILTGSSRIVDHDTFVEMHWQRDPFVPQFYQLPSGFQRLRSTLSSDFVRVLEDVRALQHIRNRARHHTPADPLEIAYINNHQASIQSRLLALKGMDPLLECVRLAAYLCSSVLCCSVWCGRLLPDNISAQLLQRLQVALEEDVWVDNIELLRWLVCMGGSFATTPNIRAGFTTLSRERLPQMLGENSYSRYLRPVPSLAEAMQSFVWSGKAFSAQVYGFWAEVTN
ncbi:hypothetical protein NLU13_9166 [Sarocladium strictum]|uniref:Uncharacterized protein n=1 Tax=Sarocladium strictum TaxID=5046 RepID=A0AA39L3X6_SARSR|nr:hypothetical protein NLU13_9166 [Sarocladium strictum]